MAEKNGINLQEIEASLKRMLNMPPVESGPGDKKDPVIQMTDTKEHKAKTFDNRDEPPKEHPSSEGASKADETMPHCHHQSDPSFTGTQVTAEDQQQGAVKKKKKKKKPKKKNKQENGEGQTDPKIDEIVAAALSGKENETSGGEKKCVSLVDEKLSTPSVAGKISGLPAETKMADTLADRKKVEEKTKELAKKTKEKKEEAGKKLEEKNEESWESDDGRPITSLLKTALKVRYLDDKLTPAELKELEKEKIFPLRKKSAAFPNAKYFCRLCEYHCDNIPVCRQHYHEPRHKRRVEIAVQDRKLKSLPLPSKRQLECLDSVLMDIYEQHGLSEDLQKRADIASSVQGFLTESIPGIELRVYGSSLTGFGLKSSGLNMDLVVPDGGNPAQLLTKVYRLLSNSDNYNNVKSNFMAKVPSVIFDSPCGSIQCEISVNSDLAYYTSTLLAIYSRIDLRVRQLAVVYRYWARVCQIDDQQKGSLPAYTFGLMTVFYLQQCKPPVLPILWQDLSEAVLRRPKTPNDILTMLTNLDLERQDWVCKNDHSIGRLWLGLLLFYGVNFSLMDYVISIRQERLLLRSEKKWKTRRMAIEDPFSTKRNVGRTLFSARIFDYVYNCIRKGCLYFSLPTNHQTVSLNSDKSRGKLQQETAPNIAKERTVQVPNRSCATSKRINDLNKPDCIKSHSGESAAKCSDRPTKAGSTETVDVDIADSSVIETALTASGSSSGSSIKENEFFVQCQMENKESPSEMSDSGLIQEHSFLSSGEDGCAVKNGTEKSELSNDSRSRDDNCCSLPAVKTASVAESDLKKEPLEEIVEESAILHDKNVDKDDQILTCDDDIGAENLNMKGAGEKEVCDDDYSLKEKGEKDEIRTGTETGAIVYENSRNKLTNDISEDLDSSEPDNLLGIYTQDDTDVNLLEDETNSEHEIIENEKTDRTEDTLTHSFLNEGDNNESLCEQDSDIEDIIGHSFFADDSLLTMECDSSEGGKNLKEMTKDSDIRADDLVSTKESDRTLDKDGSAVIETGLSSGSDSDHDLDSLESSPKRKKKLERPASPENAEYKYIFTVDSLTDGKGPSIFCSICEKEGHLKGQCPEEQLPEVRELPPISKQHLKLLTKVIKAVPGDFQLTRRELDEREAIRWSLEAFIQELFPEAECSLFGSSKNGFGFHYSDLDICVTFRGRNPAELNFVDVIEALSKKLKTHKSLYNVFPITTAKVPIVKFTHRPTRLEGDISLYNTLAQQNTRLLNCYSRVDTRVVTLGYAIKVFAKVCDIGDASKGSLSSYAYMLLLFHYLQHTKPPVIPVLQELKDKDEEKEFIIDGWNAWFYDDIDNLSKVWPDYNCNKQSVGELWLGLFRYYAEQFNVAEEVVTIRQFEPLTRFEKLWNGKCIAIEDPFDLSHNLGAGLTRKMHKYIMSALINARELYGTSITGAPDGFNALADYFFDRDMLTEGDVPNDRLCRVCSKIGHIAKECPRVIARKEREAEERRRKEEQRKAQEMRDKGGTPNNRGNNQNRPKQHNRSHPGPSRSLSDPADSSPRRPHGRGQMFINRQFSSGADLKSFDSAQGYGSSPRRPGTNNNPSSPQPIPSQTYTSRDRQTQGNSPRTYQPQSPRGPQNLSPGGFNNHPFGHNPFQWANWNDNSGRQFQQPNQNSANIPHFTANQNQGFIPPLMQLPIQMQNHQPASGNRGYSSSPNQNQGYQNRKQPPRGMVTNEDKDFSSSASRNLSYNRSQQQPQQQGSGSRRQVTMTTGANSIAGMGVTVNNEYFKGNKGKT